MLSDVAGVVVWYFGFRVSRYCAVDAPGFFKLRWKVERCKPLEKSEGSPVRMHILNPRV